MNARSIVPIPTNEPIKQYLPNSSELNSLKEEIKKQKEQVIDIPLIIGGKEIFTDEKKQNFMPHNHKHLLANYSLANKELLDMAIEASLEAKEDWEAFNWEDRVAIFLKAADLLSGSWRAKINAATMLGQSKNIMQAEIDSACELIDFFRFNSYYLEKIYSEQPMYSPLGQWNRMEYRPLEGFVFAVTPFNFTSIAGNLPSSPALAGNVVLWKPASSSVYSSFFLMKLFEEAGLPDGVINFIPGSGSAVGKIVLPNPDLGGIHFTGSTDVFRYMWKEIGLNIANYKSYPRIVGETGGKGFIFVHKSASEAEVVTAALRGSFEYAGQKCSASSRMYVPESIWPSVKNKLLNELKEFKIGDPENLSSMINAVIDKDSFSNIQGYLNYVKESSDAKIITTGKPDDSLGYFIPPTIIETNNHQFKTMREELFGPVLTVYPYPDNKFEETLEICDNTSIYSLTGAIFASDRKAVALANKKLKNSSGNFYINDKPTGAVVGQQPFGGSRASGTNDKAGSPINLMRWMSPRAIKENLHPITDFRYKYMRDNKK